MAAVSSSGGSSSSAAPGVAPSASPGNSDVALTIKDQHLYRDDLDAGWFYAGLKERCAAPHDKALPAAHALLLMRTFAAVQQHVDAFGFFFSAAAWRAEVSAIQAEADLLQAGWSETIFSEVLEQIQSPVVVEDKQLRSVVPVHLGAAATGTQRSLLLRLFLLQFFLLLRQCIAILLAVLLQLLLPSFWPLSVMPAILRFVTLCLLVAGALYVHGRLKAKRYKNHERERRRALLINRESLSGTAVSALVSSTCFDSAALAGIYLLPFKADGLPAKKQHVISLKVISVGTGSDLRVCVTVQHAPFPTWMQSHGEEARVRRETKARLVDTIQRRLKGRLSKVLLMQVGPDLNATKLKGTCNLKEDDVQVILIPEGSRLSMDAAQLTCTRSHDADAQCAIPSGTISGAFSAPSVQQQPFVFTCYHVGIHADLTNQNVALKAKNPSWSPIAVKHAAWVAHCKKNSVQGMLTIPCAKTSVALQLQREELHDELYPSSKSQERDRLQQQVDAILCPIAGTPPPCRAIASHGRYCDGLDVMFARPTDSSFSNVFTKRIFRGTFGELKALSSEVQLGDEVQLVRAARGFVDQASKFQATSSGASAGKNDIVHSVLEQKENTVPLSTKGTHPPANSPLGTELRLHSQVTTLANKNDIDEQTLPGDCGSLLLAKLPFRLFPFRLPRVVPLGIHHVRSRGADGKVRMHCVSMLAIVQWAAEHVYNVKGADELNRFQFEISGCP